MTTDDTSADLAALKEAAREVVETSFNQRRQVVLLSYVGQTLTRRGFDLKRLLGEHGLAQFVRQELADALEIVSIPTDEKVLAAYPKSVDLSKEIDPFGRQRKAGPSRPSHDAQAATSRLQIHREIWFAFSHELQAGNQRVVRLTPPIEYQDYSTEASTPDGVAVPSELIVPIGALPTDERNQRIYQNIIGWAASNGIDLTTIARTTREKDSRRSLLDALLSSLKPSELERITMPLDIVNQLRLKRL